MTALSDRARLSGEAKERATAAADTARAAAHDISERLGPYAESARAAAVPKVEAAREKITPAIDRARESVGPRAAQARENFL